MSFVDLNAPSAGELLSAQPALKDGSKGARNMRGKGKKKGATSTPTTPITQAPKTMYEMRRNYMNMDRETWRQHWLEIKNLFIPYRSRWLDDGGIPNRGNKKMQYIVDNTPLLCLRTMSAGLMSGMTSPSRPWFRLRPSDDDIYAKPGVAQWCERATDAAHRVLQKSNFYRQMPSAYSEIGAFGTASLGVYEIPHDPKKQHQKLINVIAYTIGEYWISQDDEATVDTFIRKFKWTVRQVIMKFVTDPFDDGDPAWENLSPSIQGLWRSRQWETWVDIVHVIEPNTDYVPGSIGQSANKTRSVYYELAGDPEQLLGVLGFSYNPVKVARWETNSDNVWGHSPAMYALGDSKQLMVQQKRKMQAIDKLVEPPLIGDAAMKRTTVSQLPGDITWLETTSATTFGLKPLYEVKPELQAMLGDIEDTRKRIQAAMYTDVFQMMKTLGDQLKAGITATEIDARKQEQLLELGPLLDRLNGEWFEPLIDQVFTLMVKRSRMAWQLMQNNLTVPPGMEMYLPPPPPALSGVKLDITYISILAQAVRVAEVQGINQITSYVLQLVEAKPDVLDKVDFDKATAILADRLGVPPEVIVSDDMVKQIRAQRQQAQAQAQQAQQQQEQMTSAAQAAKNLGQTPVGGSNALDQLMNGTPANSQQAPS